MLARTTLSWPRSRSTRTSSRRGRIRRSCRRRFPTLSECLQEPLRPALGLLLSRAAAAGSIRPDVPTSDLLQAVATLCLRKKSRPSVW
ncbi:hypothetical protein [Arthrobacter sp. NicSoilB8]|uniref:SbtR family transcriptional regulator n=1 Tax=Arthrobacter sp. NicSoilB8 TaxID=2830998 RepID=UPI003209622E